MLELYFIASILTLLVTIRVNAKIQFLFVWPNEVWVDEMSDGLTGSQVTFLMYLSVKIINTTCIVSCKCIPAKACARTESVVTCAVLYLTSPVLHCT